jgi:hypothetical protein
MAKAGFEIEKLYLGVGEPEGSQEAAEARKARRRRTETIPRVGPTLRNEALWQKKEQ